MIVISNKPGQLGNLLIVYSNFIAFGLENKIRIANPAFHEYQHYFIGSKSKVPFKSITYRLCFYLSRAMLRFNLTSKLISAKEIAADEVINLDEQREHFRSSAICFVHGWLYRGNELLSKHNNAIRSFFRPQISLQKTIDEFFARQYHSTDEVIVGVHIRRGDYKEFQNGRYFYSLQQYETFMEQVINIFPNKQLRFLVCSNDQLSEASFNNKLLRITFAPGHQLIDMYCLARCNYIIGPPSTYSMWASFYGNVPLFMISDVSRPITLDSFTIQAGF